ncbi:MAG: Spy/CpxP family protein refolding chaperone [Nitrospinae bacterium]|nr:Spy/CpxP family protein refolding chaperone [Nitrospinota bacterium]
MKLKYFQSPLFTAVVIITVVFALQTKVLAHGPRDDTDPDRHAIMEKRMEKIQEQLGLSEEQKAKIKEHRKKHFAEVKELQEQIHAKMEELHKELQKADFDEGKVRAIHSEIKTLKMKGEDNRIEDILDMRKILTPEQHKKFMEMREKFHDKDGKNSRRHNGSPFHGR